MALESTRRPWFGSLIAFTGVDEPNRVGAWLGYGLQLDLIEVNHRQVNLEQPLGLRVSTFTITLPEDWSGRGLHRTLARPPDAA